MNKTLFFTMALVALAPMSARGQTPGDSYGRGDARGRVDEILRQLGDNMTEAPSRGAAFLFRSGDVTVAVRCDPKDSMRQCVDAAGAFLDRARSSSTTAPGAAAPSRP